MTRLPTDVPDRRPIRSRSSRWAAMATDRLAASGLSPNAISVLGMGFAIIAGGLLATTHRIESTVTVRTLFILAGVCIVMRLLANLFDGMVAIQRNIASAVGELYNDVPDRISDAAVLIGAGYALGGSVTMGYVATVLAVLVAYVRVACRCAGAPSDFCGPMAKPHRMWAIVIACALAALLPADWQQTITTSAYIPDSAGIIAGALMIIILGSIITIYRRLRTAGRFLKHHPNHGDPH